MDLTNLSHLGIQSPAIRLARQPMGPGCSLLNDHKTLVNNNSSKPSSSGSLRPPLESYRFCGTRGTRCLQGVQYWEVKVELRPHEGQAARCDMSLVEVGVATKRALLVASRIITPCEDVAVTLKLSLRSDGGRHVLVVTVQNSSLCHTQDLNLYLKSERLTWRCGFLFNQAKRRLTLFDVDTCQKLYDCEVRACVLYPVFSVVYPPERTGISSSITVETDRDLVLKPPVVVLLKKTLEEMKDLPLHQEEESYDGDGGLSDVDSKDDGYSESEHEEDNQNKGIDESDVDLEYFSDEIVDFSHEEDKDEGYDKEEDEEMDDNSDADNGLRVEAQVDEEEKS